MYLNCFLKWKKPEKLVDVNELTAGTTITIKYGNDME